MVRLNLGAGDFPLEGYTNLDRKTGQEVYPLKQYPDNSVDEIRASHVLEHFSHKQVGAVLSDWIRALKPGGVLKLAVPNFRWVAEKYLSGESHNYVGYVMGGHDDGDDVHRSLFDPDSLAGYLARLGLSDIQPWTSEVADCASYPVSLNLMGRKLTVGERLLPNLKCVMSMPRLAFADNMHVALCVAAQLQLPFSKRTGAFYGQAMENLFEDAIRDGAEYIVTMDYDSLFTTEQFLQLNDVMRRNPHIDALVPIQIKRGEASWMMGLLQENGEQYPPGSKITTAHFVAETSRISWGHFGLTILKASAVKDLPKPWFHSTPDPNGGWGEGRIDDDIYFWRKMAEAKKHVALANRIPIGHAQLVVTWPGEDAKPLHQYMDQWQRGELPERVWR